MWRVTGVTAILDSVVKEGFSGEVMSSLRPKWEERGRQAKRQKPCGCFQGLARKASVAKMEWLRARWERGQGGKQGKNVTETHIQGRAHVHSATWKSGMQVAMVAVRQERWQYVGIAGSQFNSYASILPPLQFQVTGAIPCLFGVILFQIFPSTWGRENTFINWKCKLVSDYHKTPFLEHPIWKM